jgi:hypothetical protein
LIKKTAVMLNFWFVQVSYRDGGLIDLELHMNTFKKKYFYETVEETLRCALVSTVHLLARNHWDHHQVDEE